jgi:hypothetical protein
MITSSKRNAEEEEEEKKKEKKQTDYSRNRVWSLISAVRMLSTFTSTRSHNNGSSSSLGLAGPELRSYSHKLGYEFHASGESCTMIA